jgi:hypothetical protein
MCYNCGCHIPDDDMGHPDNITSDMMKKIAKKLGQKGDGRQLIYDYLEKQNSDPTSKNPILEEMFLKASRAWGQPLKDAKKQTYNMLKSEM